MLKQAVVTMASVVALSGFAQAAPWKVTVSVAPTGTATVTGGNIGFNSYTGSTTRTFQVAAKSAYNLKKVVVNGQTQTLEGNTFTKVFDPAVRTTNTLSATLAIKTFSITSTAPKNDSGVALGAFSPTRFTGVKYDSTRAVALIPKKGQAVAAVTDNGSAATVYADRAGTTTADLPSIDPVYVVYKQVRENHALAATMEAAPALQARITPNVNQSKPFSFFKLNDANTIPLSAARSISQGTITGYSWSVNSTNATVTPNSADNGKTAKFDALSGGSFTVTVTVTAKVGEETVTDTASVVINVTGDPVATACNSCHKDQGAIVASSIHQTNPYRKVECQNCHNNHSAGIVAEPASSVCYSCHGNYLTKANTAHAATASVVENLCKVCHSPHSTVTTVNEHHFNGYTSTKNPKYAAAYVRPDGTCAECHSSSTDATLQAKLTAIRKAWAESGHGEVTATPWKNNAPSYIWTTRGTASVENYQNSPQLTNCVRCHTARGFAQFVDSNFTNVKPLSGSTNAAPLTCGGCHSSIEDTSATKGLRQLSSGYTGFYGFSTATYLKRKIVVSKAFGDMKNSNVCIPCHSGRSSAQLIKAMYAVSDISHKVYSSGSVSYPHDMTPAGVLVGYGGYEFTPYTGTDRDDHKKIGLNNFAATGSTQGPCVACHMTSDKPHSLEPIANGQLATELCKKCHNYDFGKEEIDAAKANFDAALKVLGNELDKKGLKLGSRVPRLWDAGRNATIAEKNNGAWYNWFYFGTSDKASYVHNPAYARKLIYDSIDWLDDNVMNSSAGATIAAQATASSITSDEALQAAIYTAGNGCTGCHITPNAKYITSKHPANGVGCSTCHNNHYTSFRDIADAKASCASCHTSVNAQLAASTHLTGEVATAYYSGRFECADCHDPHTGIATFGEGTSTGCQTCHAPGKDYSIYASDMTLKAPHGGGVKWNATAASPAVDGVGQYVITDIVGNTVNGVNVAAAVSNTTCADCHSNHNNNINIEYAESAHGDTKGAGWVHYEWRGTASGTVNGISYSDRTGCVRCHTAAGFVAKLGNESSTDKVFALNNADAGKMPEVLNCKGCHSDTATGALRTAGAFTTTWTANSVSVTKAFPDAGASNLCIRCHSGRRGGPNLTNAGTWQYAHYLPAAATVFNDPSSLGYEFAGRDYTGGSHKKVGIENFNGSGTNGPCVTCHMSSGTGHSFEVVGENEAGEITEIKSSACAQCHTGLTAEKLNAKKTQFKAAVNALRVALEARSIYYTESGHAWHSDAGRTTAISNNAGWAALATAMGTATGKTIANKDLMGAAFNYAYLSDHTFDPAAYVHNVTYASKLLADSINFLADGQIDGDLEAEIDALTLDADAKIAAKAALATFATAAGTFDAGDSTLAGPAEFAGSNQCTTCHSKQYTGWSNSLHNKPTKYLANQTDSILVNDSLGSAPGNDFAEGFNFNDADFATKYGYTNPFASQIPNAPILQKVGSDYYITIGTVDYKVVRTQGGNNYWKQRYYVKVGGGNYVLPVQYNEVSKKYSAYNPQYWYATSTSSTPLFDNATDLLTQFKAKTAGAADGPASSSWENRCAGCHQSGLTVKLVDGEVVSGYKDLNVGCEACHGPAAAHVASPSKSNIVNPNDFLSLTGGAYKAGETCGKCHQRGESKIYLGAGTTKATAGTAGSVQKKMEAPAKLGSDLFTAVFPQLGESLVDGTWYTDGVGVHGTKTTMTYNGTTTFFPSYAASRQHHQQWEDQEQGKHGAEWAETTGGTKMACWTCHDLHQPAGKHNIKTSTKVGGVTLAVSADDNTLCLSCHAGNGDFASLTVAQLKAEPKGTAVLDAVNAHVTSLAGAPGKPAITAEGYLATVATYGLGSYKKGQCVGCHMPFTPSSSGLWYPDAGSTVEGGTNAQQGDQRSHTMKALLSKPAANAPSSCTGCH